MKIAASIRQSVKEYLQTRRKLGFALTQEGWALASLVKFAEQRKHQGPLTAELAVQWAQSPRLAQRHYWAKRLAIVRRLAVFWQAYDPSTEVPPRGLFGPASHRRDVHIYSAQEVGALLGAARTLGAPGCLRVRTFATLFGLLATCGLRISEALQLDRSDLDLQQGILRVRRSKNQGARLLPLHRTTLQALRDYDRWVEKARVRRGQSAFFIFPAGCRLNYDRASWTFRQLRRRLRWTHQPPARIHDLRHTFAIRSLIDALRSGSDMGKHILLLSTYLGHRRVIDTYWYLSAVPELMIEISIRGQTHFAKGGPLHG